MQQQESLMNNPEMSRLRWRCRRGMKELDLLLLDYVERCYRNVNLDRQQAFRRLLSMPDPEILALLTGRSGTDDEYLAEIIERLLTRD
jgi:antitoxin CptB